MTEGTWSWLKLKYRIYFDAVLQFPNKHSREGAFANK